PVVHSYERRRRVLLYREHRCNPRPRGRAILDRLVPEKQAHCAERVCERRAAERNRRRLAIDEQREQLQELRAVPRSLAIDGQELGFVALERRYSGPRELVARFQGILETERTRIWTRPREEPREPARRGSHRPVHERDIELVHHQRLSGEAAAILAGERSGKSLLVIRLEADLLAPAHEMRPHGDLRARDIAPQHVQMLVPDVELDVIRALKARTREP